MRDQQRVARLKRKAFAKELFKNGFNKEKAYQTVYPAAGKETVRVNSSKLMETPEVQQEIEWRLDSLTPESVLKRIDAIAGSAKRESDKLKALELLGKYLSLFKTEQETTHKLDIDLNLLRNKLLQRQGKEKAIAANGQLVDTSKESLTVSNEDTMTYSVTLTDNVSVTDGSAAAGGTAEAPLGV